MSAETVSSAQPFDSVTRDGMTRVTLNGRLVDRRTFLGAVGLSAGALLVAQLVPASARALQATAAGGGPGTIGDSEANGAWHVDDMWGHWPPYAHPIPYSPAQVMSPARALPASWEHVHPADLLFL